MRRRSDGHISASGLFWPWPPICFPPCRSPRLALVAMATRAEAHSRKLGGSASHWFVWKADSSHVLNQYQGSVLCFYWNHKATTLPLPLPLSRSFRGLGPARVSTCPRACVARVLFASVHPCYVFSVVRLELFALQFECVRDQASLWCPGFRAQAHFFGDLEPLQFCCVWGEQKRVGERDAFWNMNIQGPDK